MKSEVVSRSRFLDGSHWFRLKEISVILERREGRRGANSPVSDMGQSRSRGIGSVKCDGKFWLRNRICPLSQAVTDGPHVSCFRGLLITAGLNKFSERIWGLGGKMK